MVFILPRLVESVAVGAANNFSSLSKPDDFSHKVVSRRFNRADHIACVVTTWLDEADMLACGAALCPWPVESSGNENQSALFKLLTEGHPHLIDQLLRLQQHLDVHARTLQSIVFDVIKSNVKVDERHRYALITAGPWIHHGVVLASTVTVLAKWAREAVAYVHPRQLHKLQQFMSRKVHNPKEIFLLQESAAITKYNNSQHTFLLRQQINTQLSFPELHPINRPVVYWHCYKLFINRKANQDGLYIMALKKFPRSSLPQEAIDALVHIPALIHDAIPVVYRLATDGPIFVAAPTLLPFSRDVIYHVQMPTSLSHELRMLWGDDAFTATMTPPLCKTLQLADIIPEK